MKRRFLFASMVGAAVLPSEVRAQQKAMPVIGFISGGSPDPAKHKPFADGFRRGLDEVGYVDGKNVAIEFRWSDGNYDRMPALVADLIDRQVKVIACGSGAGIVAKTATTTIPIVALSAGDPVRAGLVASFNRPGGNVTAVAMFSFSLGAKRLQLLRELVPNSKTIAVLVNQSMPELESKTDTAEVLAAARMAGQGTEFVNASSESDFEPAFASMVRMGAGAVLVMADPFFSNWREKIVALAARNSIPAIYAADGSAAVGGLMSYGSSIADSFRHMGVYAGQILRGAKPADLPVQQSVKVELVINLKTAKTLGLTIPGTLLARADEVIE
jgi:putative tryptophan/tyrosine transport system substrate-binding protein